MGGKGENTRTRDMKGDATGSEVTAQGETSADDKVRKNFIKSFSRVLKHHLPPPLPVTPGHMSRHR